MSATAAVDGNGSIRRPARPGSRASCRPARSTDLRGFRRHIQPIRDHVARLGIRIVDVRDEAAVHMAHAHAELTGALGVAM